MLHCAVSQSEGEWAQRARRAAHLIIGDGGKGASRADRGKRGPLESAQARNEQQQEAFNIRRLQIMISMVMSVISQDPNLTVEEASELVAGTKRAALAMFPDKELAYDIIYKPRLQRLMKERFRLQ
jgi:hypothetical protein